MKRSEIQSEEYHGFYQEYLDRLPGDRTLGSLLQENQKEMAEMLSILSRDKLQFRYAPDKWTIAEVLQHLLDVERIFQYRALCIARKDQHSLPGFDHDAYVPASQAYTRDLEDLKKEFHHLRNSGISLFESFSEEMLLRRGLVNSAPASVRALGFIIVGHSRHHLEIMKKYYLK